MLLGDVHAAACGLQSKGCGPSMHPGDFVDSLSAPQKARFFCVPVSTNLYKIRPFRYTIRSADIPREEESGMVDYQSMGRRMKVKRRSKHLSQQDMAKMIGISSSFYGNIERGLRIPSIDTLVQIANVLDVGVDYLLFNSLKAAKPQHTPEEMRLLARYLRARMAELDYVDAGEEEEEEEEEEE